jgi:hypothetical protein
MVVEKKMKKPKSQKQKQRQTQKTTQIVKINIDTKKAPKRVVRKSVSQPTPASKNIPMYPIIPMNTGRDTPVIINNQQPRNLQADTNQELVRNLQLQFDRNFIALEREQERALRERDARLESVNDRVRRQQLEFSEALNQREREMREEIRRNIEQNRELISERMARQGADLSHAFNIEQLRRNQEVQQAFVGQEREFSERLGRQRSETINVLEEQRRRIESELEAQRNMSAEERTQLQRELASTIGMVEGLRENQALVREQQALQEDAIRRQESALARERENMVGFSDYLNENIGKIAGDVRGLQQDVPRMRSELREVQQAVPSMFDFFNQRLDQTTENYLPGREQTQQVNNAVIARKREEAEKEAENINRIARGIQKNEEALRNASSYVAPQGAAILEERRVVRKRQGSPENRPLVKASSSGTETELERAPARNPFATESIFELRQRQEQIKQKLYTPAVEQQRNAFENVFEGASGKEGATSNE